MKILSKKVALWCILGITVVISAVGVTFLIISLNSKDSSGQSAPPENIQDQTETAEVTTVEIDMMPLSVMFNDWTFTADETHLENVKAFLISENFQNVSAGGKIYFKQNDKERLLTNTELTFEKDGFKYVLRFSDEYPTITNPEPEPIDPPEPPTDDEPTDEPIDEPIIIDPPVEENPIEIYIEHTMIYWGDCYWEISFPDGFEYTNEVNSILIANGFTEFSKITVFGKDLSYVGTRISTDIDGNDLIFGDKKYILIFVNELLE